MLQIETIETNDRFEAAYHLLQRVGGLRLTFQEEGIRFVLFGEKAKENDYAYRSGKGLVDPQELKECLEVLGWMELQTCLCREKQGEGRLEITLR